VLRAIPISPFYHITCFSCFVFCFLVLLMCSNEYSNLQASSLLWVQTAHFGAMLIARPFCSITDNVTNLAAEAAGFLPLAIAVFAEVDPTTCKLSLRAETMLMVSAFLGVIVQFAVLAQDFGPMMYSLLSWLVLSVISATKRVLWG